MQLKLQASSSTYKCFARDRGPSMCFFMLYAAPGRLDHRQRFFRSAVFGVFSDLTSAEAALAKGRFDTAGAAGSEGWARVSRTVASIEMEPV